MRLPYILMAAVLTLSIHQVPANAFVGSDVALAGVTSLGFLHLVGADQSISDQSRFLRGKNIAEGDEEERGWNFGDVVEKLMAKHFVNKVVKTESLSAVDKVDDLAKLDNIMDAADNHAASMFKFAHENKNMRPSDLATELKTFKELDDDFITKTVGMYTDYLKKRGINLD
ncbi:RxLR effector protein [Phytophthora megakarya]|uniref:RxLR effector protein n=1 Tax=Phytophthora megakarya TaxID=4795 RepID=A0A225WY80_9STRA|nr:RxLR effector protein [Phytophthora megakarya]